jgi:hypothetical protein
MSEDRRSSNQRPVKYDQPKSERYELRLTEQAKNWLKDQGGPDYIEKMARESWAEQAINNQRAVHEGHCEVCGADFHISSFPNDEGRITITTIIEDECKRHNAGLLSFAYETLEKNADKQDCFKRT